MQVIKEGEGGDPDGGSRNVLHGTDATPRLEPGERGTVRIPGPRPKPAGSEYALSFQGFMFNRYFYTGEKFDNLWLSAFLHSGRIEPLFQ